MKLTLPTRKQMLIAIGASGLLAATAFAQAAPDAPGERCRMKHGPGQQRGAMMHDEGMHEEGEGLRRQLHALDLGEAQRDAVFAIFHAQAPAARDKAKALRKAREALRALALSGKYDEARAGALAREIADNAAALSLLRARTARDVHALLTPEQRRKLEEFGDGEEFRLTRGRRHGHAGALPEDGGKRTRF